MHAITVAQTKAPAPHRRPEPIEQAAPHATTTATDRSAQAASAAELRRWSLLLGIPFVLSASFFMAAIGTAQLWLMGGVLVTGPGLMIMAFIYLGLSSDTNGLE